MPLAQTATKTVALICAAATIGNIASHACAQVRVAEWNITNWRSTSVNGDAANNVAARGAAFKTALYGISNASGAGNGLQFAPDILVVQEIIEAISGQTQQAAGNASVAAFLSVLNTAPGSPGDWAAAPYIVDNGDTGNAMFYRTSKFVLVSTTSLTTNTGTGSNQAPRDTGRWHVRLQGYPTGVPAHLYLYGSHFKAGSASSDQLRREPEGERIRIDANGLPDTANFVLCGDLNIQASTQTFYQYMVGASGSPAFTSDLSGRFFDPINTAATWENNSTHRFIHTQDPAVAMDSRHDQILIAGNLRDGQGLDYLPGVTGGNILAGWNTTTWNDTNHTYRCWGNDGSSYDTVLNSSGNTMVGNSIASALVSCADGLGHLPVYVDLKVPAKLGAPPANSVIDFGTVAQNSVVSTTLGVSNAANVALYSKSGTGWGVDGLTYTLAASSGFSAPGGAFERSATAAPAQFNMHSITMSTTVTGMRMGTLTIASDDPDEPSRIIQLVGNVVAPSVTCCRGTTCITGVATGSCTNQPGVNAITIVSSCTTNSFAGCCYADFDKNGSTTIDDIFVFLNAWFSGSPYSDFGGNGSTAPNIDDIFQFLNAWFSGCA